jgi:hypothetical protein
VIGRYPSKPHEEHAEVARPLRDQPRVGLREGAEALCDLLAQLGLAQRVGPISASRSSSSTPKTARRITASVIACMRGLEP